MVHYFSLYFILLYLIAVRIYCSFMLVSLFFGLFRVRTLDGV